MGVLYALFDHFETFWTIFDQIEVKSEKPGVGDQVFKFRKTGDANLEKRELIFVQNPTRTSRR